MKKIICVFLSVLLMLTCIACGDPEVDSTAPATTPDEPTTEEVTKEVIKKTPAGFILFGYELANLTAGELAEAVSEFFEVYKIKVTLGDYSFDVAGASLGVKLADGIDYEKLVSGEMTETGLKKTLSIGSDEQIKEAVFNSYYTYLQYLLDSDAARQEAEKKGTATQSGTNSEEVIVLTEKQVKEIKEILSDPVSAKGARIEYSKKAKAFVGVDGEAGEYHDYSKSLAGFKAAVLDVKDEYTLTSELITTEGEKAEGNEKVTKAIEAANKYFETNFTCNFISPGGTKGYYTLTGSKVADYLYVGDDGLSIHIDEDELTSFCSSLVDKYSNIETTRVTEGTKTVITRKGWTTDVKALYEAFKNAILEKKRGDYTVTFTEVDETVTEDLNNSVYVYVDLTAQTVYLYENGQCIFSTPCVSGKVAPDTENGRQHYTSRGTFEIYDMERNRYLEGTNSDGSRYKSFVKYWMPFYGGQGLHDASWRDSFGGDIYYWSGSHGCVNLPEEAAKTIWEHVHVGTKVIVTGGLRTAPSSGQQITCNSVFNRNYDDGTFNLGATCLGGAKMVYQSSDTSVITVDENGNVTPVGAGSASVTITAQLTNQYWGRTTSVTVNITGRQHSISVNSDNLNVTTSAGSFNIGAVCETSGLTYNSTNSSVATVDNSGNVTIKGTGTAKINITAGMTGIYANTTKTVIITVTEESTSASTEPSTEAPSTEAPVTEEPSSEEPTLAQIE